MAVSATYVVAPMLAAAEGVVLFPARMTGEASFGNLLGGFVLEGDDLRRIAFFDVRLAWSMTRLTTGPLVFPTAQAAELGVRSRSEVSELIFVAVFAGFTADVLVVSRCGLDREVTGNDPHGERE